MYMYTNPIIYYYYYCRLCIMAYGIHRAGKTYSVFNSSKEKSQNDGIFMKALNSILNEHSRDEVLGMYYIVSYCVTVIRCILIHTTLYK